MATYTNRNGTSANDILTYDKGGSGVVYNTGAGNDTVKITGGSITLVNESGSDTITISGGSGHVITGGPQAETLKLTGGNVVDAQLGSGRDIIQITLSDGRKSSGALSAIRGGDWTDTFTLASGAKNYQLYGDAGDDVFEVKGGSNLVLWGGAANDTFTVSGGTNIKLRGGDSADSYNISTAKVDMQLGYGNDVVKVTAGDGQLIKGNLGINTINLMAGSGHVLTSDIDQAASKKAGREVGYGVDKVYITDTATNVTANLGDGKDIVEVSSGSGHKIYTEGWGDTLVVKGTTANSFFYTGDGDDVLTVAGQCQGNYLETGSGNDQVTITAGSSNKVKVGSGNNIVNVQGGSHNQVHTEKNGTLKLNVSGRATLDLINIINETTILDASSAMFGLTEVKVEDTGKKLDATLSSQKDVVKLYSGSNHSVLAGAGADEIYASRISESTLKGNEGDDYISLTGSQATTYNCIIEGGEGNDEILVSGGLANKIYGGAGNDNISLQDSTRDKTIVGKDNIVYGGSGDDTITVSSNKCTVYGEDGEDKIHLNGCKNVTVHGGKNSDHLYVENGASGNTVYGDEDYNRYYLIGNVTGNVIYGTSSSEVYEIKGDGSDGRNRVIADDGFDSIFITDSNFNQISGGLGGDNIKVSGGIGNIIDGNGDPDTIVIKNKAYYSEVGGDDGDDDIYVINDASFSKISGSAGNDTIEFDGKDVTKCCYVYGGSDNDKFYLNDYLEYGTIIGGLGNDLFTVGGSPLAVALEGNKLVGGAGNDTYCIDIRRSFTYVDAATGQRSNDRDSVEVYVSLDNFALQIYRDTANGLELYSNANDARSGSLLLKGYANCNVKFYEISSFGQDKKVDVTNQLMRDCQIFSFGLDGAISSFGADAYGTGTECETYSTLKYFLSRDADLTDIEGNL